MFTSYRTLALVEKFNLELGYLHLLNVVYQENPYKTNGSGKIELRQLSLAQLRELTIWEEIERAAQQGNKASNVHEP